MIPRGDFVIKIDGKAFVFISGFKVRTVDTALFIDVSLPVGEGDAQANELRRLRNSFPVLIEQAGGAQQSSLNFAHCHLSKLAEERDQHHFAFQWDYTLRVGA